MGHKAPGRQIRSGSAGCRNRDLGRAGEEFVVAFERRRLERAGKPKLAKDVRWVSDLDGDGYGYDVHSFDADSGEPRLLEIKTTCGNKRTPFWVTRRECDVAAEQGSIYRIRRVFHFRNQVKMFDIVPAGDRAPADAGDIHCSAEIIRRWWIRL